MAKLNGRRSQHGCATVMSQLVYFLHVHSSQSVSGWGAARESGKIVYLCTYDHVFGINYTDSWLC